MSSFHASFARALFAGVPDSGDDCVAALVAQPAFAVYRNTVLKGCIDALEANFPAVVRLVGRDWFRSAAAEYARQCPPTDARLLVYGDGGFGAFLQALPSAASLPWLAGVAHLDSLWRAVHVAADAPVLRAEALAQDAPDALAARVLRPHPAMHWAWFEGQPVASLWARNRSDDAPDAPDAPLDWRGEGLLFTRAAGAVGWQPLAPAGCALLDACAEGACLGEAADRALQADPQADLANLLAQLLQAGAFLDPTPSSGDPT